MEANFKFIVKYGIVISTKIEAVSQNEAPKRLRLDCGLCAGRGGEKARHVRGVVSAAAGSAVSSRERFC